MDVRRRIVLVVFSFFAFWCFSLFHSAWIIISYKIYVLFSPTSSSPSSSSAVWVSSYIETFVWRGHSKNFITSPPFVATCPPLAEGIFLDQFFFFKSIFFKFINALHIFVGFVIFWKVTISFILLSFKVSILSFIYPQVVIFFTT